MATTYTYSIIGDFSANVEPSQLQDEITASAIVTAISRIDTIGDACNVIFPSAISGGDQTILDGLIAAHVPVITDTSIMQQCYIYSTGGLNIFNETSEYDIPLNTETKLTTGITHVTDSPELQITVEGTYRITYKITIQSIKFQSTGRYWLSLKPDAGSYVKIAGSEGHYFSTDPEQVSITSAVIVDISENDTVKMVAQGMGADDDFILIQNDSSVQVQQLS